jgi:serine/threonine protein kinase
MIDANEQLAAALKGSYVVERLLGAGGMATVYLAHDVRHERKVALKVLRPELALALGGERFVREVRITAGLSRPIWPCDSQMIRAGRNGVEPWDCRTLAGARNANRF